MYKHRIIVFGLLYHQHVLNFSSALKKYLGYEMIGINNNPNYRSEYKIKAEATYSRIYNAVRSNIPFLDRILKTISTVFYFLIVDKRVDFALFHFLSKFVYPLAKISHWRGIKTSIFVFGSDFKRSDDAYKVYIGKVFNIIDSIVCDSTDMLEEMKTEYPQYSDKMHCCFFGSPIVDELLQEDTSKEKAIKLLKLCDTDKKVVMCGYNGCMEQHHLKIIDCLSSYRDKLHFIFPMTYSCNDNYREKVYTYCEKKKLSFTILDHFLENDEWKKYIIATDIFVHMQLTDAFSACLAENLLLGNVVVNSEWITYPDLLKAGAYYLPANFENLQLVIKDILDNYDCFRERSNKNRYIIERFKGLEYTVKNDWGPYFESICEL